MKIITCLTAFLLTANLLFAQIINIPADYPTIQQGINAANTGDTVLVQPGTYNEHLNFNGKEITVGSLFLTTQDTSYINQTVITGSNSDTEVIIFENDETINTILCGLKITFGMPNLRYGIYCSNASPTLKYLEIDGTGNSSSILVGIYCNYSESVLDNVTIVSIDPNYYASNFQNSNIVLSNFEISDNSGSGIYCVNTNLALEDGIIKNNNSSGISCDESDLFLSGVTINYNRSTGIYNRDSEIVFDTVNLCNIYFNSTESGTGDLRSNISINLVLDTFSVLVPTSYYASPLNNFSFDILNGKLNQVDADVFISPQGSDSNSGLTPNEPFKTIRHASMVLLSDSLHPRTLQLLEGTYSKASNDEMFPAVLFDYTSLIGISPETVILDGEDSERLIYLHEGKNTAVTGMTVTNGFGIYCVNSHFEMEDIDVMNNSVFSGGGLWLENSTGSLNNIVFENNQAAFGGGLFLYDSYAYIENTNIVDNTAALGGGIYLHNSNPDFNNVVIDNNSVPDSSGSGFGYGGGVYCDESNPVFRNTLFTRNSATYGGTVICCRENSHPRILNSTITDNEQNWDWEGPDKSLITSNYGGHDTIDIINSIIYANDSCRTLIDIVNYVSYSNIEKNYGEIWQGEGNINEDPMFVMSDDHPYQINDYSPCIDVGTPDTTGLNLPELDLAGNPRLVNNRIDMGAYEWNMFVGVEEPVFDEPETANVSIYPNPATSTATLSGQFASGETVNICIYNTSGICLKSWEFANQQTGQQEFTLNLSNLSPGIYFLRLQSGNEMVTKKIIKI